MFKKKNCFCSKEKVGILDGSNRLFNKEGADVKIDALSRNNHQLPIAKDNLFVKNNQIPSVKDNRSCVIVDLLSSAIIRLEMKSRSRKERIINKNNEERTGLLRTVGQNRERFINDYNKETI
jgi:hypothetical protein